MMSSHVQGAGSNEYVRRVGRWVGIAALGLLLAGCTSLRVGHDYDRSANFSGFRKFSWMPRQHHGSRNPLVVQRAQDAIAAELTHKGFAYVSDPATADFIVDFTIGSQDRVDLQSFPEPYTGPYWGYTGWWGYRYWGSQVDVRQYREGTLSIDAFDAHTHKPVWHGWASKELTSSDLANSEQPIHTAVEAVLAKFPPQA